MSRVMSVKEGFVGTGILPSGFYRFERLTTLENVELVVPSSVSLRVGQFVGKLRLDGSGDGKIDKFVGELNPTSTISSGHTFSVGSQDEPSVISSLSFINFFFQYSSGTSQGTLEVTNGSFGTDEISWVVIKPEGYLSVSGTVTVNGETFPKGNLFVRAGMDFSVSFPVSEPYWGFGTTESSPKTVSVIGSSVTIGTFEGSLRWFFVPTDGTVSLSVSNSDSVTDLSLTLVNPKGFGKGDLVPPWGVPLSDELSPLVVKVVGAPTNGTDRPFIVFSVPFTFVATRSWTETGTGTITTFSEDKSVLHSETVTTTQKWFVYRRKGERNFILFPTDMKVFLDLNSVLTDRYPKYWSMKGVFDIVGVDDIVPDPEVLPNEGYIVYVNGSINTMVSVLNFIAVHQRSVVGTTSLKTLLSPNVHLPRYIETFLRELVPMYPYRVYIDEENGKVYVQIFCGTNEPTVTELNKIMNSLNRFFSILRNVHPPSSSWTVEYRPVHRWG